MLVSDRNSSRRIFFQVWEKYHQSELLEPMENLILNVIQTHPEYHHIFENQENLHNDYDDGTGTDNPFLHMGLHIALTEQIETGRPSGIVETYKRLLQKYQNEHEAQHLMMECLGESLRQAQAEGIMPDECAYLDCIRSLK